MELALSPPQDGPWAAKRTEFALQNRFATDPLILEKYAEAGRLAGNLMAWVVARCQPGADVAELCRQAHCLVQESPKTVRGWAVGLAWPVCIMPNEIARNYAPWPQPDGAAAALQPDDVVKIEFALHVEGYIAWMGHTLLLKAPSVPALDRPADVVCAAHLAMEAAIRMIRPGVALSAVSDVVRRVAKTFRVHPVAVFPSVQLKRFIVSGEKEIGAGAGAGAGAWDGPLATVVAEVDDVFAITMVMSTRSPKPSVSHAHKPTIHERDAQVQYSLRLETSRDVFAQIDRRFPVLPFAAADLSGDVAHVRFGLAECLQHNLLRTFPVYTEKEGETVALFVTTVAVTAAGCVRITPATRPPYVHSSHSVEADAGIAGLLKAPAPPSIPGQQ